MPCEPAPMATWVQGDAELTLAWASSQGQPFSFPHKSQWDTLLHGFLFSLHI